MSANLSNKQNISPLSFVAGGTIKINCAVKLDSTEGQVVCGAAITDLIVGVATQAASSGDNVPVQTHGIAKMLVGTGGITMGDEAMVVAGDADGSITTAAGATARSIGVALSTGLAGETVPVLLCTPTLKGPANA